MTSPFLIAFRIPFDSVPELLTTLQFETKCNDCASLNCNQLLAG
jgi:hypothetical protein